METLTTLKKRLKLLVEKPSDFPLSYLFDIKNLVKIVKVGHKTMLENLISLYVYL
jgi:hypothetical protein